MELGKEMLSCNMQDLQRDDKQGERSRLFSTDQNASFGERVNSKILDKERSGNLQVDLNQAINEKKSQNASQKAITLRRKPISLSASHFRKKLEDWNAFFERVPFRKFSRVLTTKLPHNAWTFKDIPSTRRISMTTRRSLKMSDFTAEPMWEFDDNYIVDTLSRQTSCPISVKIKAMNSLWLKEKFLPQITIFMDNRHFSNLEWQRLEHFIPPFGWMELNYTASDVKEVVSALPHLPNQQILLAGNTIEGPRCVSCAVVGNGGILNGSRLGQEIDNHDYVFRVNGAVTKGFEIDVGNRTSFYGFTAHTMYASLSQLQFEGFSNIPKERETKYILYTEGQRDFEWLEALQKNKEVTRGSLQSYRIRPRDYFGKYFNTSKLLIAHPDFMRYIKNRFLRSTTLNGTYWNLYRPSTGAMLLLTAVHLCDTVSAYGFMTHDYQNYSDHYYDKDKKETTLYINHDFLLERNLWRNLHGENIIKLYLRK
ncbi:alpha-N-acetylgalactosaminide alpha-2,6-sialyltransferase 1 [Pelobates cultripes]|uniref:alpha-N-acetylgalactosaminide alpha-2,6-sialyltransferase n=1 Tax=Pelobates cultripes TaxID=61616 RepID=A0AAD1WEV6_PELCU|nr:alpha-N-acetylgalactosaminide alpha-2,6-sialyltransferase 1 [Pelobates cultripes]